MEFNLSFQLVHSFVENDANLLFIRCGLLNIQSPAICTAHFDAIQYASVIWANLIKFRQILFRHNLCYQIKSIQMNVILPSKYFSNVAQNLPK